MKKKAEKLNIAIFGMSANPPHLAHIEAINCLLNQQFIDEVWVIPAGVHPFEKDLAKAEHRWAMAKMIAGPKIKVRANEIWKKTPTYTIDTIRALKKKYRRHKFWLAIGSDIVAKSEYKRWKDWDKLRGLLHVIVFPRPGYPLTLRERRTFEVIECPAFTGISSTQIRDMLRTGQKIGELVPPGVATYILRYHLYKRRTSMPKKPVDKRARSR